MKNFPKTLYVVVLLDENDEIDEWIVKTNSSDVANDRDHGTEVGVYELIKLGTVKHSYLSRNIKWIT